MDKVSFIESEVVGIRLTPGTSWILELGFWVDTYFWDDTETWID